MILKILTLTFHQNHFLIKYKIILIKIFIQFTIQIKKNQIIIITYKYLFLIIQEDENFKIFGLIINFK